MSLRPAERVRGLKRTLIREIFESAPADAINLGLGQPDLRPPEVLEHALAEAATEGRAGYGPTQGQLAFREAIAASYAGFAGSGADVLVTVGCQQATFVTLGCVVDPGDEVLVPDPGFPGAARAASAWGARPVGYALRPEDGFHVDPERVQAAITPRTRAIVVITPSNPIGSVESAATLRAIGDVAESRGIAVLLDDTYRAFSWVSDGLAPSAPEAPHDNVIVCGGLSKAAALTGWRVGWAITPDAELMARMVALQQTVLTCAATPIQLAARAAFGAEGLAASREIRARFAARREMVVDALADASDVRVAPLEGAFYAWIDVERAGGGRAFAAKLLEDGVVVIPGEAFGASGESWVRVSYAQDERQLARALELIVARLR
jgi:aspartate aminotransferase